MAIEDDTMDIESEEGTLVRFSHPENGYTHHQEQAKKFLEVGEVYTVEHVDIHSWHSDVYLKEFPGEKFNTVLFSQV